jgi:hypothetical protein
MAADATPTPLPDAIAAPAAVLAQEVATYSSLYNEIRPHEALGWRQPLAMHRADSHLLQTLTLQHP